MPVSSGSVVWMTPATSPSPISRIAAPVARTSSISRAWRGRSRMQAVIFRNRHALGLGQVTDVFDRRRVDIDEAGRIARADGDLFHVDVGSVEQAALFRDRDHGKRIGQVLGADRGAFKRIERDVDFGPIPRADLFADIEHRRLVALALADDHGSPDRQPVQFGAHGIDRDLIGGLLVAPAAQSCGSHRCALGDAHQFDASECGRGRPSRFSPSSLPAERVRSRGPAPAGSFCQS